MEGQPINLRIRTIKVDGETYLWPDSNKDDDIHRPLHLECLSSYEMTMNYKKVIKSKKDVKASSEPPESETPNTQDDDDNENECNSVDSIVKKVNSTSKHDILDFLTSHPRNRFTKLSPLKNWVVPIMYYDGARLWNILSYMNLFGKTNLLWHLPTTHMILMRILLTVNALVLTARQNFGQSLPLLWR